MKKKTIKINFEYFGPKFNPQDNFFTNTLRKLYNVEISGKPNYLFYSVYPKQREIINLSKKGEFIKKISSRLYILLRKIYSKISNFSIKNRFPLPEGNYIKIFVGSEHIKPDMTKCDWAFGSHFEEEINNTRYMRLLPSLFNDYNLKRMGNPPLFKKIDFKKIKKEKKRFCNFIYSQDINARNNFFKKLNKYKKIDAPGRCMTNMPPINYDNPKESRLSPNWSKEKLKFINSYKFTISFENSINSGWVTEKLIHPMLVNSIPIYFGHKNVDKEFNTKSFINCNDFKNMKDFINHIIKVDKNDNLYEKYLKQPYYKNNKCPKDIHLNDKKILKKFREIFD